MDIKEDMGNGSVEIEEGSPAMIAATEKAFKEWWDEFLAAVQPLHKGYWNALEGDMREAFEAGAGVGWLQGYEDGVEDERYI